MMQHAIEGSVISTLGLVAQATLPIPEDLKSWPVTAMLALITLACLGIIAYQIRSMVKTAEVLAKLAEKQETGNSDIGRLTDQIQQLVLALHGRPCIAHRER